VAKLQPSVDSIVLMHMMHHGVTFVKHVRTPHRAQRPWGQPLQAPLQTVRLTQRLAIGCVRRRTV
jgi:hypothetical protein